MELFNTHSRKRTKNDADKASKKEETVVKESEESSMENKVEIDGTLFGACYDPGTNLLRGFETNPSKIKSYSKKSKKEITKNDTDHEEDVGPEWIDGEPQGTESYIVDGNDGELQYTSTISQQNTFSLIFNHKYITIIFQYIISTLIFQDHVAL